MGPYSVDVLERLNSQVKPLTLPFDKVCVISIFVHVEQATKGIKMHKLRSFGLLCDAEATIVLCAAPNTQAHAIAVRARDTSQQVDKNPVRPPGPCWPPLARRADGSDAGRMVAWPEKGKFDIQLSPNRNGRKW